MKLTTQLYRPVGLVELRSIEQAGKKAFPPRLPHQPIFYPVLTFEYAERIAREWNAPDPHAGYAGIITQFDLVSEYICKFEPHLAGGKQYQELWVPASELDELNRNIVGSIRFVAAYYGREFSGKPIALDVAGQLNPSELFRS